MFRFKSIPFALICAGSFFVISAGEEVSARSYAQPPARCMWQPVVTYQYQTRSYFHYVTRYDHHGHPYRVRQVCYKTVKVPVTKWVKVCY
ncbi:MAG: hypothetical protein KDA70_08505 [Planctomycetaceae bacterium]|nr:hypothetical protein [Planctomycetaceae bacterium]MCA9019730.1 hypothetical protein [Planctomycetaceae bacterium]